MEPSITAAGFRNTWMKNKLLKLLTYNQSEYILIINRMVHTDKVAGDLARTVSRNQIDPVDCFTKNVSVRDHFFKHIG